MIPEADRRLFYELIGPGGLSRAAAARRVGISENTATAWARNAESTHVVGRLPGVKTGIALSAEARRALDDFEFFRLHYLGHLSTPWQTDAALKLLEWLRSPDKEYVVVNAPPGSGKSTLFTLDLPLWLIVRDRSIRIMVGSSTFRMAEQYTNRIRRMLERKTPVKAKDRDITLGLAVDARGVLLNDYGRFQPDDSDRWTRAEFVVAQHGDHRVSDKEATVSAFGWDNEFLGGRYDLIVWDDLMTRKSLNSQTALEQMREGWEDEAETRLEPAGLLVLQGQRMGPQDIYRHALDMTIAADDEDDTTTEPKYRHVVYPAHFDELCSGEHPKTAEAHDPNNPTPGRCLLDPQRIRWRELRSLMGRNDRKYRVLYQQQDIDPDSVLVQQIWVDGGVDENRIEYPGCKDPFRGLCELPPDLSHPYFSYATVDPSVTNNWAVQWYVYHPASGQRFLLDCERRRMTAPEVLGWDTTRATYTGIMFDWQTRSVALGIPIRHWVVEAVSAFKHFQQYDHVTRFQREHQTLLIPHATQRNKADPDKGVEMLAPLYQHGLIRLPWRGPEAKFASMKLIEEVTHYPEFRTDDQVMAQWFGEFNLPRLIRPTQREIPRQPRPSWLRSAS